MFHPYPDAFPKEAVAYLVPLLRGNLPASKAEAVSALWTTVGYGASFIKDSDVSIAADLTPEACASLLEDALRRRSGRLVSHAAGMPWASIVKLLGPLLLEWLAGRFVKA